MKISLIFIIYATLIKRENNVMKLEMINLFSVTAIKAIIASPSEEKYSINLINHENQISWKIERYYYQIRKLHEALLLNTEISNFNDKHPILPENNSENLTEKQERLENYFNDLFKYYALTIWSVEPLLKFIDDVPTKSIVNQLHIRAISKQLDCLQTKSLNYDFQLRKLENGYDYLVDCLRKFCAPGATVDANSFAIPHRLSNDNDTGFRDLQMTLDSPVSNVQKNHLSFISTTSVTTFDSLPNRISCSLGKAQVEVEKAEELGIAKTPLMTVDKLHMDSPPLPSSTSILSTEKSSLTAKFIRPAESPDVSDKDSKFETPSAVETVDKEVPPPNSKYLPADLLPSQEKAKFFDDAIADVIETLQPHESQLQYRASIVNSLKRHSRACLFSTTFDIGVAGIRCFLPDDSTRLTVIVAKMYLPNWHVTLSERLSFIAERGDPMDEDDHSEYDVQEQSPVINHVLSNVNVTKQVTGKHSVNCIMDNMEVEIVVNCRLDQCLMAFVEEVAGLVGCDGLFKRSLILIRAWWCYETASYVGCPIRHYLSDWSVCIMVCAIFNLHHKKISSPFQALCLFLAEYSIYDGNVSAITIQGITPFVSSTGNSPVLAVPKGGDLIGTPLLEKYWNIFHANTDVFDEVSPVSDHGESDLVSYGRDKSDSVESSETAATVERPSHPDPQTLFSASSIADRYSAPNFERQGFNVVNPINNTNTMVEKLSQRRLMRLTKAFQIGAANLSVFLKQTTESLQNSSNLIKNYFPAVSARFIDDWRPDALQNSVSPSGYPTKRTIGPEKSSELMSASATALWRNILYGSFLLENIVSESALLTVTIEILRSKGPLPVGEIGKVLAELTCIPNLSAKLKERFGGLKKFLEQCANKFAISNDHPFNPHVMLRDTLSVEHLELIDRGIFPSQLVAKTRKTTNTLKKIPTTKKQPFLHDSAVEYGPKSTGISAYMNAAAQHGRVARNPPIPNNNRSMKQAGFIPFPSGLSKHTAYTGQDPPQNVSNEGSSGHQVFHPYMSQQQYQSQSKYQSTMGRSSVQGHSNQTSSYDRRYLPSQTQSSIGSLVGNRNQADQSHQASFIRGSGDINRISNSAYQPTEFMNSVILGDEGHSNNFLSELRDQSPEIFPIDTYKNQHFAGANTTTTEVNMRNSNSSKLFSFASAPPSSSSASYGTEQSYQILDRGYIGAPDRDAALNMDSFFSHGASNFMSNNATTEKSTKYGLYPDGLM